MPGGAPWPRVSIVTPSYNQAQFLEETIRSVLLQGYPNLEYIVIDGGSTDGSVEIIRKYEPWLAYWVSEPDVGQSDAINKGMRMASGEIVAWINSDDCYQPAAVEAAVLGLRDNQQAAMVHGHHMFVGEHGQQLGDTTGDLERCQFDRQRLLNHRDFINQPTVFMRRAEFKQVGSLRADLHYAMDYDLWLRLSRDYDVGFVSRIQARYRLHTDSKTTLMPYALASERYQISRAHGGDGVGIALRTLELRWRHLASVTATRGPSELLLDFESEGFHTLPPDVQAQSRAVLTESLLDGAYICMRLRQLAVATRWLIAAARIAPRRVFQRGNLVSYLRMLGPIRLH